MFYPINVKVRYIFECMPMSGILSEPIMLALAWMSKNK